MHHTITMRPVVVVFYLGEKCDTAWATKLKQMVLLEGHTWSLSPEGLIDEEVEQCQKTLSHGSW